MLDHHKLQLSIPITWKAKGYRRILFDSLVSRSDGKEKRCGIDNLDLDRVGGGG